MEKIKMRGKHLDQFETVDVAYIAFNRCVSILFVYHMCGPPVPSCALNPPPPRPVPGGPTAGHHPPDCGVVGALRSPGVCR